MMTALIPRLKAMGIPAASRKKNKGVTLCYSFYCINVLKINVLNFIFYFFKIKNCFYKMKMFLGCI